MKNMTYVSRIHPECACLVTENSRRRKTDASQLPCRLFEVYRNEYPKDRSQQASLLGGCFSLMLCLIRGEVSLELEHRVGGKRPKWSPVEGGSQTEQTPRAAARLS